MDKLKELENRIKKLEDELAKKKTNQLTLPIDVISQALIREHLPVFNGVNTSGAVAVGGYIEVNIDGIVYKLLYK